MASYTNGFTPVSAAGDLMFLLMLFMFCFFIGFAAMFFYLIKRMDDQVKVLSDEHAQIKVLLRAMESRIDKITRLENLNAVFKNQMEADGLMPAGMAEQNAAGHDPLLHLSFEQPHNPEMNMGQKLDLTPVAKSWDMGLDSK